MSTTWTTREPSIHCTPRCLLLESAIAQQLLHPKSMRSAHLHPSGPAQLLRAGLPHLDVRGTPRDLQPPGNIRLYQRLLQ